MLFINKRFIVLYALFIQSMAKIPIIWLASSISPVIGFFSNTQTVLSVYLLRTALLAIFSKSIGIYFFHVPTLCGSLYLSSSSKLLKASLPVFAILLFLLHPVGLLSWTYTLYWFPPLLLTFFAQRSIFIQALSSTLVTHAIGSVLWLHSHQTTPAYWHALHSVVWLERLLCALLLTASYYLVTTVASYYQSRGTLSADGLKKYWSIS